MQLCKKGFRSLRAQAVLSYRQGSPSGVLITNASYAPAPNPWVRSYLLVNIISHHWTPRRLASFKRLPVYKVQSLAYSGLWISISYELYQDHQSNSQHIAYREWRRWWREWGCGDQPESRFAFHPESRLLTFSKMNLKVSLLTLPCTMGKPRSFPKFHGCWGWCSLPSIDRKLNSLSGRRWLNGSCSVCSEIQVCRFLNDFLISSFPAVWRLPPKQVDTRP